MSNMNRRNFLKRAALAGVAGAVLPGILIRKSYAGPFNRNADLSIIEGTDLYKSTLKAVEKLGGMKKFVKKGQKVGLLINSDFTIPGAYTHPDVSLAVLKMCFDQGASEVTCLQNVKAEYWERSERKSKHEELLAKMKNNTLNQFPAKIENGGFVKKELANAKQLKEAEIIEKLFDVDVLINLPIAKHHATALYTGALKNTMGVNTRKTNVFIHLGGPEKNDPQFFAECIADINKLRPADLTVVDASKFITTGGPVGPGEMMEKNRVLAGTDMVALDAIGMTYHGLEPKEVPILIEAEKAGLGTINYNQLNIVEEKA